MSLSSRVTLPIVAALSLIFMVACGNGSSSITPPPTGAFSNSNLNGTYVFSTQGTDSSGAPITVAGQFTACGCSGGTISAGTFSYFDPAIGNATSAQSVSSGSYGVTADGRGQATLANSSALGTITLDFVLNSTSGGTITFYNSTGTGSGTLELQSSGITQASVVGSFGYSVGGEQASGNYVYSSAGAFTLSSTGQFASAGVYDLTTLSSSGFSSIAGVGLTTASSVTVGTPGSATIADANGNTYTFDVYPVSNGDLKLIEMDNTNAAVGEAFTQGTSLPSGTLAFTMSGYDSSGDPLATGGLLPVSSGSVSGGLQDFNDNGTANTNSGAVGGGFGTLSNGRAVLQLTSFYNGASTGNNTYTFAAYPTANGTLLVEIDGAGITAGSALGQSNTSFAASQGYGANVSGINISGESDDSIYEEDDIAEFSSTSSSFSGLVDVNDEGTTYHAQTFDGNYSSLSSGRYTFAANASGNFNGVSGVVYTVDGQTLLFLEGDTFQVGTGIMQVQNASGTAVATRFVPVTHRVAFKNALKRKK
jgi:hypothetical protein